MAELVRISTHVLEAAGWAVIMIAVAASTVAYLRQIRASGFDASDRSYRADLGRGILLGLELLIAADILKTLVWMYVRLAHAEEREMVSTFGDAYRQYAARVPGLVPTLASPADAPKS